MSTIDRDPYVEPATAVEPLWQEAPPSPDARDPELEPTVGSLEALAAAARREVSAALWLRDVPEGLSAALLTGVSTRPRYERVVTGAVEVDAVLAGWPSVPWLRQDLAALAGFMRALGGNGARLRVAFGPILDDRCRKFHVDRVHLRLLCTYAGPGTEWAPAAIVNRDALARPPFCEHAANAAIVREPDRIVRCRAGDVLLLSGVPPADAARKVPGAVHRSPPLGVSAARLPARVGAAPDAARLPVGFAEARAELDAGPACSPASAAAGLSASAELPGRVVLALTLE